MRNDATDYSGIGRESSAGERLPATPRSIDFGLSGAALFALSAKGADLRNRLERRYGFKHLHFITCSCYRRLPLLGTPHNRDVLLEMLSRVRSEYRFSLVGYVVMPEHIHLLVSEPPKGTPSTVMQVLKQRVARILIERSPAFWQRRFYDFNVWSRKKMIEKVHYMHANPTKRGLVTDPGLWKWSSYRFYQYGEKGLCDPDPEPR